MTEPANVVTYLDFAPSAAEAATPGLKEWAAHSHDQSGASEARLLREMRRPERFALVETWADPKALHVDQASGARGPLSTTAGLAAPPDERVGEPFSLGPAPLAEPGALHVLVHVDVIPFNLEVVGGWLTAQAEAARAASGALGYDVWRQAGRPNHFTVIQVWADDETYARHVAAPGTHAFRANLLSVKGALYDERLYRRVD